MGGAHGNGQVRRCVLYGQYHCTVPSVVEGNKQGGICSFCKSKDSVPSRGMRRSLIMSGWPARLARLVSGAETELFARYFEHHGQICNQSTERMHSYARCPFASSPLRRCLTMVQSTRQPRYISASYPSQYRPGAIRGVHPPVQTNNVDVPKVVLYLPVYVDCVIES